jgi:hypothetical protein
MFLEPLESRDLLAYVGVTPEIVDTGESDELFALWRIERLVAESSPLTVYFDIDGTATEELDYEILPRSATIPANETSAYVMMTPIDDHWIEGTEDVLLIILPHSSYEISPSGAASLAIEDDDFSAPNPTPVNNDPQTCDCPCTCPQPEISTAQGKASGDANVASTSTGAKHSSKVASGQVVATVNLTFPASAPDADLVEVKTTLNNQQGPTVTYDPSEIEPGVQYQLAVAIDVDALNIDDDGYYPWGMEVIEHYPDSPDVSRTATAGIKVVHFAGGEFGKGWAPMIVDRLQVQDSGTYVGALWIRGDFNAYWFGKVNGVYQRQAGEPDFSTLEDTGNDFTAQKLAKRLCLPMRVRTCTFCPRVPTEPATSRPTPTLMPMATANKMKSRPSLTRSVT